MKYLYIYVKNIDIENVIKYGIKLSEFANKVINLQNTHKYGITAYLAPKDSPHYFDNEYSCIKILLNNLNCLIYNQICENTIFFEDYICDISQYEIGTFEDPIAFIQSTILPENIQIYNKIQDIPLLIQDSKQYYYEKSISEMLDNSNFSKYELYQLLLILGEQKKILESEINNNVKIYIDKISGKKYTKKSSF